MALKQNILGQYDFLKEEELSQWCTGNKRFTNSKNPHVKKFAQKKLHRTVSVLKKNQSNPSPLVQYCACCPDDFIATGINNSFRTTLDGLRKQLCKKGLFPYDYVLLSANNRSLVPYHEELINHLPNGCALWMKKKESDESQSDSFPDFDQETMELDCKHALITNEECFQLVDSLPPVETLISHLKLSKEVFILQNRLTLIDRSPFLDALMHAISQRHVSFKCTLYHPRSQLTKEREDALSIRLADKIASCIKELHGEMTKALAKANHDAGIDGPSTVRFENCEFRFANQQLPYTIYGFDNRIYLGWLVSGVESDMHPHLVLQGPGGAFEVVRSFFNRFWDNFTTEVDMTKRPDEIFEEVPSDPSAKWHSNAIAPPTSDVLSDGDLVVKAIGTESKSRKMKRKQ
jgi:hypothetical protein